MGVAQSMRGEVMECDDGLRLVLEFLHGRDELSGPVRAVHVGGHSNDVFELRLGCERSVVVKRGRHAWARERFARSRDVARAILASADIVVPEPFALPQRADAPPLQAYWRVPLPTLAQVWPRLSPAGRVAAMRSWGELLGRLHRVRVGGWGDSWRHGRRLSLVGFLHAEIAERLLPACHALWPPAVPRAERLLAQTEGTLRMTSESRPALAHNDQHMGNVLCQPNGAGARCVGFLDLEAAIAAPPECDAASLEVLHGPHFEQHLARRWPAEVRAGYGRPLDPARVSLFRALHLLNLGFYSALVGHHEHAGRVLVALEDEVTRLDGGATVIRAAP